VKTKISVAEKIFTAKRRRYAKQIMYLSFAVKKIEQRKHRDKKIIIFVKNTTNQK
jgi:hypothetical protein